VKQLVSSNWAALLNRVKTLEETAFASSTEKEASSSSSSLDSEYSEQIL